MSFVRYLLILGLVALAINVAKPNAGAQAKPATNTTGTAKPGSQKGDAGISTVKLIYFHEDQAKLPPLSLLDLPPLDDGIAGAKLAISDNNTTGRFLKQAFELEILEDRDTAKLIEKTLQQVDSGVSTIIADASAATILKLADALKDKDVLIFNIAAGEQNLREQDCRRNVLHTAPSYAMLADALAQYTAWKRWRRWFLVHGDTKEDAVYVEALVRAAKRYGQKIVETKQFDVAPGNRRADGGYQQVQKQIPTFTQGAPDHDLIVIADVGRLFGDYFPYRTWLPRPVVGTSGLYPTSWHAAVELWGGTQMQNRFRRSAKRAMRALDYNAWLAIRSVGEAAVRTRSGDPKELIEYLRSDKFEIGAFKGQRLTFRDWNGQLRQPIFIAHDNLHVSVSPQDGFLHKDSELDTLGYDRPETKCKAWAN